jgi:hypothetical protein
MVVLLIAAAVTAYGIYSANNTKVDVMMRLPSLRLILVSLLVQEAI